LQTDELIITNLQNGKAIPVRVHGRQKIEINPPVSVTPATLIFPFDPKMYYDYQLKATGGSGRFAWSSNKKKSASINENGLIRTGTLGEAVIRAEDARNPLHFDLAKVLVVSPSEVGFAPSPVEAEIGAELTLNVKLLGHLNDEPNVPVPFTDCRQADLRFGVRDPRYFEVVNGEI
jgi:hypothetical protein